MAKRPLTPELRERNRINSRRYYEKNKERVRERERQRSRERARARREAERAQAMTPPTPSQSKRSRACADRELLHKIEVRRAPPEREPNGTYRKPRYGRYT